jgi:hypothetical protein
MQRKIKQLFIHHRQEYGVFAGLSVVVLVLTAILYYSDNFIFERFLGAINPLVAFSLIILAGAAALTFLLYNGWFNLYKGKLKGIFRTSVLALLALLKKIDADTSAWVSTFKNVTQKDAKELNRLSDKLLSR